MTYDYDVDSDQRLVSVRLAGAPSRSEILELADVLKADARISSDFSELIDLRGVTAIDDISGADIRAIAASPLDDVARRVFVAPVSAVFGLARMFAAFRDMKGVAEKIAVFQTMEDARRWLSGEL